MPNTESEKLLMRVSGFTGLSQAGNAAEQGLGRHPCMQKCWLSRLLRDYSTDLNAFLEAGGDSSQDEVEDDIKQITVGSNVLLTAVTQGNWEIYLARIYWKCF